MVHEMSTEGVAAAPSPLSGMVPTARFLIPRLFIAGVLPAIGYTLLRPHVGADWKALAIVLVFPLGLIVSERVRQGFFDPVGVIAMIGILVGLTGALVFHGNATLLKMRDSLLTGVFGVVCIVSLAARRPIMFALGRAFATAGDPTKVDDFNAIWDAPGAARRFRMVTAVWGFGLLTEAVVRLTLALTISTQHFVEISPVVNFSTLGALLWFTTRFIRAGEREALAAAGTPAV